MASVLWTARSSWADALLASELSAIANASGVLSGATAVANGTARHLYADVSFRLASFTPTAGGHIAMYLLPLLDDGTTYADGTTSGTATAQPTGTHFAGSFALRAVASAQNGMIRGIMIPPGTFKWYLINRSGASLATTTTANIVKYCTYAEEVV
jgi:hypothetical protein